MYAPTARTTATRERERMAYDPAVVHSILDEAFHCAMGFVVDGEPRVLPTLHVRVGDTLYLHGSTGSRPLLAARGDGLRVCVTVTLLDGLVLARSQFNHSANYRSVVAHGVATLVRDEETKRSVLTALVEKVGAGRSAETRPPTKRELAETAVLALPLVEVSARQRSGGVIDDEDDLSLPHWAGVLPLRLTPGVPEPDAAVAVATPAYLRPAGSPWLDPAVMRGSRVLLEPLDLSHADDLFKATADPQVWQHLTARQPRDRDEMAAYVAGALAEHHRGERVPWVQRSAVTGEVLGTTSFYEVEPGRRSLAIGHTFLGRSAWRTGVNPEAKLLLLTRAFETLGAERVVWHTDIRNTRSQAAIERLGATREAVLRHHRIRPDGTWRDTVQYAMLAEDWPAAATVLRNRSI
ncbi:bifunctional pyridoxamine 5'-phosphate oxidase family protein/GNAT family N-acetyltransferase [Asanoa sp. NPDC049573]|uniref:bifunctional pyridoxamine 5'-phosphate oxidase family protein/GNAT family N-acetyltransferase n=1 Tax=Asanoa sp. NPDC049573 TaxID=3155396 RepID=UPI00342A4679